MSTVTKDISLGATLTEEQARQIVSQGEEAVILALLALAKQLADQKFAACRAFPAHRRHPAAAHRGRFRIPYSLAAIARVSPIG